MKQKLYEAMFLLDAAKGGSELPTLIRHICGLLQREEAEIERIEKWDERKMAYRIRGVERGLYVLVYFRADPGRIAVLRRAVNLSEEILRVLFLQVDEVPPATGEVLSADGEKIEAPAEASEQGDSEEQPEKEESDTEQEGEQEGAENEAEESAVGADADSGEKDQ